ncbi:MAG TPA: IS66 family transposase [Desulfitobacteriaceae bacterium]|nr:IS66 family transposase [Desulfitobacteriaceae bacterium]
MTDQKDAYIAQLENTVKTLQQQVSNLTEIILLMKKKQFGSSSEKTPKQEDSIQINLFNEAEDIASEEAEDPIARTVAGYIRKKSKTKREELLKDLPVQEIIYEIAEEESYCPHCNGHLEVIGQEVVREQVQYIPAKIQIERTIRKAYGCTKCKHHGTPYVIKAQTPAPVMNHSLASSSSVAHVMYQKYVNSVPLYRQEKDWEQMGIALSRGTMGNWVIKCSQDWFSPIIEKFKQELLKRQVLHCDETTVQVLKEAGKVPQTKSYMWLYRTGADTGPPVVLFDYQPSRGGKNAAEYLKAFTGFLHTDAYSGYVKVMNVTRCCCWAHVRRYFIEAIPVTGKNKSLKTNAELGRDHCNKLFEIERTLADLTPELRKQARLEKERAVLDDFWAWLDTLNPVNGSKLAKAVQYTKNQKAYLENYLLDGRCSISNNLAENCIRPFAVGRKNWLFSDTPRGADASAMVYSIIETAKANDLNLYKYLNYLLTYMPGLEWRDYPEIFEDLMPWSKKAQEICKN